MDRIAIDAVLLPDETMMDKAIEANGRLVGKYGERIVLNKQTRLPHISLAMGCIEQEDIGAARTVLSVIASKVSLDRLTVTGIRTSTNSLGEEVSAFEVEKIHELQLLHEQVMEGLAPYLTCDVTARMLYEPAEVGESTLLWIENFREKSSFAHFFPHITIGYGRLNDFSCPKRFNVTDLAICHLGNHCTCRKVLTSIRLR
jgi:2'-5' RNA ligase